MKRLSRRDFLLFALPFVALALVTLRPAGQLRLYKDRTLFPQEVAQKIPVGMTVTQAEELLKSSGFSRAEVPYEIGLGAPLPVMPKMLGFMTTQGAFPRFLDKHVWRVTITVRGNRVQNVDGFYRYSRFD